MRFFVNVVIIIIIIITIIIITNIRNLAGDGRKNYWVIVSVMFMW